MAIFQNRQFLNILQIGPRISRINWCEGHWYGSIYMVEILSGVSSKTGKKCIFCIFRLFLPLCQTASWPHRLSYINGLCINQSYKPKDGSVKFSQKNLENWRFWKTAVLKNRPFWNFSLKKIFFFLLHFYENQSKFVW